MTNAINRTRPASMSAAVADLAVGEEVAKLQRVNTAQPMEDAIASLGAAKERLRNAMQPVVARAKAKTSGTYTVEISDFFTTAKNWFLVAVITRTA